MEWMLMPLKRYFDFEGRSRRKEFWMFTLFYVLIVLLPIVMLGIGAAASGGSDEMSPLIALGFGLIGLIALACLIPSIAVQVRRFHDQDKSGWLILLNFIPAGGIVILVFMCLEGTRGPNQYGPDPKQ